MKIAVLTLITLLALPPEIAQAGEVPGEMISITNRELINSQTGAPLKGCPKLVRLQNAL